ncbi:MAG: type II secretion system F family protein [Roseovarius sp.]|nr:type II secretion system F family protein [Roseovarius sp.]
MMEFNLAFTGSQQVIFPLAIAFGTLCAFFGIFGAFYSNDTAAVRMRRAARAYGGTAQRRKLMKTPENVPVGLLKALVPEDQVMRTQIRIQLEKAGFTGPNSVRNFYLFRLLLAMSVPTLAVLLVSIRAFVGVSSEIDDFLNGLSNLRILQILAVSTAVGFYTPTIWLNRKIKQRRRDIEEGFPNAMDLLQISSEAGLGFDAAMTKVGQEIARVSPVISDEFLQVQTEVLAGRERSQALSQMAIRMDIPEAHSFVNVIIQSMQYGSSISEALKSYAVEMRDTREINAQEKANKLPVKMSAVMASLMLPTLFMITLGPIVIRYIRVFGDKSP